MQMKGDHFVKAEDERQVLVEELSDGPATKKGKSGTLGRESAFLIKNTLRNKENIKRLIKSMPIPWDFLRLTMTAAVVSMICIAAIIVIYVLFGQLFNTLSEEIRMIYYQLSIVRSLMDGASLSLQMVQINEY